ncbi:hypothetical protein F0562_015292 [Nyssa sinensis]|uniref:Uncharacterized protein n=1 Tax=Nyssa sinensis TaxID=561372 RepID=A0A5J4ZJW1_9ASTE|nr:hypothetical protein F0562_015292 [Nyssa sinensis]
MTSSSVTATATARPPIILTLSDERSPLPKRSQGEACKENNCPARILVKVSLVLPIEQILRKVSPERATVNSPLSISSDDNPNLDTVAGVLANLYCNCDGKVATVPDFGLWAQSGGENFTRDMHYNRYLTGLFCGGSAEIPLSRKRKERSVLAALKNDDITEQNKVETSSSPLLNLSFVGSSSKRVKLS